MHRHCYRLTQTVFTAHGTAYIWKCNKTPNGHCSRKFTMRFKSDLWPERIV